MFHRQQQPQRSGRQSERSERSIHEEENCPNTLLEVLLGACEVEDAASSTCALRGGASLAVGVVSSAICNDDQRRKACVCCDNDEEREVRATADDEAEEPRRGPLDLVLSMADLAELLAKVQQASQQLQEKQQALEEETRKLQKG